MVEKRKKTLSQYFVATWVYLYHRCQLGVQNLEGKEAALKNNSFDFDGL